MTQARDASENPRSALTDGSATLTMVVSRTSMSVPRHSTVNASHRRRPASGVAAGGWVVDAATGLAVMWRGLGFAAIPGQAGKGWWRGRRMRRKTRQCSDAERSGQGGAQRVGLDAVVLLGQHDVRRSGHDLGDRGRAVLKAARRLAAVHQDGRRLDALQAG